jgi:cell division protein FtsN
MLYRKTQFGGTFLGLVVGLLVGLSIALAVAIYVTKVPVPFLNKSAPKSNADQDAEEAKKNKNWDPNAPLYGKNPAKPNQVGSGAVGGTSTSAAVTGTLVPPVAAASAAKAAASAPKAAASKPASSDPLGDLAKAKAAGTTTVAKPSSAQESANDPFVYFVQIGAFRTPEDAEAQRAKAGINGFEAKITEREQSGRPVYRVRVGPIQAKSEADSAKEKLEGAGFESALVRVAR